MVMILMTGRFLKVIVVSVFMWFFYPRHRLLLRLSIPRLRPCNSVREM